VRELRNIIERLVIMTPGDRIEAHHLPALARRAGCAPAAAPRTELAEFAVARGAREDFEKRYIWKKYEQCGGNMSRTPRRCRSSARTCTAR
jgi:two-component system nitrogen regulation response regulator NtrX